MVSVKGCHLVGSVPGEDAEDVFRKTLSGMPGRLKRIPDGETGVRLAFTAFQHAVFPELIRSELRLNQHPVSRAYTDGEVEEGMRLIEETEFSTGYDDEAIKSYSVFRKLKDEGVVPPGVKFQVSLPTLASVVGFSVAVPFQAKAEPFYEAALFKAIRNMQDAIPHEDLAIQIDVAVDILYLEDVWQKPWFESKDHIVDYISREANQVADDVDYGYHTCYGDMAHKHFIEPASLEQPVSLLDKVLPESRKPPTWIHCPVPLSAMGKLDSYLAPLATLAPRLERDGIELYLGLVHHDDHEGARTRIESAGKFVPQFGVATECGWGRTPPDELQNIMSIHTDVSSPVLGTS